MAAPVVVILAAGQGTRMRSEVPKLLHPLLGRPLISWPVAAAREAGAGRIVVVEDPSRPLDASLADAVEVAIQTQPLGTADAVRAAGAWLAEGDTVVVVAGDVPLIAAETIRALVDVHEREGAGATVLTMVLEDPDGYGRVVRAPDGTVERVVETKVAGDATELELHIREVNTGIYAFEAAALMAALEEVRDTNAQREQYLPDVVSILRRHERTVVAHELPDADEALGINDRVQLARVRRIAQRRIHERHMRAGVTIVDPAQTVIDVEVEIGQDTVVEPFSSLLGRTRVGEGARIGPATTLVDCRVGDGAVIVHSFAREVAMGENAEVGPFACLGEPAPARRVGAPA